MYVTRHIFKYLPQYVNENDREVSGISPGVLGSTGIETQEILKGIVDNVKPKLIIAIDSLASKKKCRKNKQFEYKFQIQVLFQEQELEIREVTFKVNIRNTGYSNSIFNSIRL